MMKKTTLPIGIADVLVEESEQLEYYRRQLLDYYASYGYALVLPPFIEYASSLVLADDSHLDKQTFKVTDHISNELLAIRADITPQIARIAKHYLDQGQQTPIRLSYAGEVVHTQPRYLGCWRNPFQFGIELVNAPNIAGDCEVINLLLSSLHLLGIEKVTLNVGHAGIVAGVLNHLSVTPPVKEALLQALQDKCLPRLHQCIASQIKDKQAAELLKRLAGLYGDVSVLGEAVALLSPIAELTATLAQLQKVTESLQHTIQQRNINCQLHVDLTEHQGYAYQNGIMFTAYHNQQQIASGGYYTLADDNQDYPAIGFSADLKQLMAITQNQLPQKKKILVPACEDKDLDRVVDQLRDQGHILIHALTEDVGITAYPEHEILIKHNNQWSIKGK